LDSQVTSGGFLTAVRSAVPWIALAAVVWAIAGIYGQFARSAERMAAQGQGSGATESTSAAASQVTTVTDLLATARVAVSLRSQPSTSAAVAGTVIEGSALVVVARQGMWFQVRDKAGHIGWVVNDAAYLSVRTK
jgi:SH3-like domain-containing protein